MEAQISMFVSDFPYHFRTVYPSCPMPNLKASTLGSGSWQMMLKLATTVIVHFFIRHDLRPQLSFRMR